MERIKDNFNYKNSLRGIEGRQKHESAREKSEKYRQIAESFLSYKTLIDCNARPAKDAMLFYSKDHNYSVPKTLQEEGKMNMNFDDQKALFKIGQEHLKLKKRYLDFIDSTTE